MGLVMRLSPGLRQTLLLRRRSSRSSTRSLREPALPSWLVLVEGLVVPPEVCQVVLEVCLVAVSLVLVVCLELLLVDSELHLLMLLLQLLHPVVLRSRKSTNLIDSPTSCSRSYAAAYFKHVFSF